MCLCGLTNDNREYIETRMSSSQFIEQERKKLKREWESLQEPKPSWEEWKRMTSIKRNTFLCRSYL